MSWTEARVVKNYVFPDNLIKGHPPLLVGQRQFICSAPQYPGKVMLSLGSAGGVPVDENIFERV